jgi:hypothetical protein
MTARIEASQHPSQTAFVKEICILEPALLCLNASKIDIQGRRTLKVRTGAR